MFQKLYDDLLIQVDSALQEFMLDQVRSVENNPFLHYYYNKVKDYLFNGGKRFRPILMILSHTSIYPESISKGIIQASLSLELLHNASLIHDDIMDNAVIRRGKRAFHRELRKYAKENYPEKNVNCDDYGLGMGILGGDYVYNLAYKSIHVDDYPPEVILRASKEFNEGFLDVVQGVIFETDLMGRYNVSEEEYLEMITGKTAALFERAARMGAVFAQGSESQIECLGNFGRNSGIAFQLVDDIIGTFGDSEKTGKPVDSDLREGKKTILVIKAFQNATKEQGKRMNEILGKQDATQEEINEIRDIIRETGALDYTHQKAEEFYNISEKYLDEANPTIDSNYKKYLSEIARMGVYRVK
ncbi:MAG: polyprenyl synthetase family protein [Candidatus Heimdallarchaeota archaeon]